jgi:alpha-tubulin suppressor-like RCC1 family protein
MRRPASVTTTSVLVVLLSGTGVHPQANNPLREDIKRLIVRIEDGNRFGAGIIFGAANDEVYVVTANHVVRDGDRPSQDVQVEFYAERGKHLLGKVAMHFDIDHDLAVVIVPNAKAQGIDVNAFPFDRMGDPTELTEGDPVFLAGHPHDVPWSVSVTPDGFVETQQEWLRFESKSLFRGHSGGALLNSRFEIVGLLKSDEQPNGEALSIAKVLAILKEWGYPIRLRQRFSKMNLETLSSGGGHSCYVNPRGVTSCWGSNSDGELGIGSNEDSHQPSPVQGHFGFVTVSAGFSHSCGVTANLVALCWGDNTSGQLGSDSGEVSRLPVPVLGGIRFAAVSAGLNHSCGLTTDGTAYCWGDNGDGQLGSGNKTDSVPPVPVKGEHIFTSIRAGVLFTCGITTAGGAYCWGANAQGRLGNGSTTDSSVPVPVSGGLRFTSISTGDGHACAVSADGQGYCWGDNKYGQLGNGSTSSSSVPVPVAGRLLFKFISAGKTFSCGITREGTPYCWGWGNDAVVATEVDIAPNAPAPVFGSRGLVLESVATGLAYACGLTATNEVYCWGANRYGQLGNGSTEESVRPVLVSPLP